MDIYKTLLRPLIFSNVQPDPEWWHHQTMQTLRALEATSGSPPGDWVKSQVGRICCFAAPSLEVNLWGLRFPNPIGLAAGFDKNGEASTVWPSLGFGFMEMGTVTYHPQPGNPRPRMFRLPADLAAINRMGFNNQGAEALAQKLAFVKDKKGIHLPVPLGINLGKSKITPIEEAPGDYLASFRLLKSWGDYFAVNVSSPNTPGLRSLQAANQLAPILDALQQENQGEKPILVKIAPDLAWEDIAEIIAVANQYQLAGIIATNTTISRDNLETKIINLTGQPVTEEAGGLSGAPLRQRSTEVIRFIYQQTGGKLPIIGTGGIFTAADAWEKITAGATLLEAYTGLIYEGPLMVRHILEGLVAKLEENGLNSITEAVGFAGKL
ncbi:quinone-dependent dihydroorotate dehydrogenase [[Phormidium] sp. ETS-05]|uniref:quinone-dependent dihydroorotate dehydrogenase n=1 Tax=[Phormidium] sp. ETS-05 TaxID=222819 RepID=UPI0018EEE733|nr:quinone-dependent dihydroorotate dehydrogenase [[Phormidium] sp. ETS-05]